jgi:hypothetical protein
MSAVRCRNAPPGPTVELAAEDELDGSRQAPEHEKVREESRDPGEDLPHAAKEDENGQPRRPEDLGPKGPVLVIPEACFGLRLRLADALR